jgi:hypothetical protein
MGICFGSEETLHGNVELSFLSSQIRPVFKMSLRAAVIRLEKKSKDAVPFTRLCCRDKKHLAKLNGLK